MTRWSVSTRRVTRCEEYTGAGRDSVPGEDEVCDPDDAVDVPVLVGDAEAADGYSPAAAHKNAAANTHRRRIDCPHAIDG